MKRPPAARTTAAWFVTAAPVNDVGAEVVGPTGVAVAEPPGLDGVVAVAVPLPDGTEAPPLGVEIAEINVVGAVPEGEQGTVMVVPLVTIVV